MNALEIPHHRLCAQRIAGNKFERPDQVLAWFGAMQGQEIAAVQWAIGLRCARATLSTIEEAVADRTILRTWLLRGTLHMAAARDVHWMLDLIAPRLIRAGARRQQQLELDEATLAKSREAIVPALEGSKQLTRAQMKDVLEQAGIAMGANRLYHLLHQAALEALICFGPMQGRKETFVLLAEWAPRSVSMEREDALAELARRYVRSHGPATLQDFVWWSGLTVTDARAGLESAGSQLHHETIDGELYWMAQDASAIERPSPTGHLLPAFDEYYVAYKQRDLIFDAKYRRQAVSDNGVFRPVVVIDGHVEGIWKQAFEQGTVTLSLSPFRRLSEAELHSLTAAAERYGGFLGLPVVVRIVNSA